MKIWYGFGPKGVQPHRAVSLSSLWAQDYNIGSYNRDIQQKAETLRSVTSHMNIHVPTGVFCDLSIIHSEGELIVAVAVVGTHIK